MRSLVSGASGHVGAFVVRRLLQQGAQVQALVRPQSDLWRLSDQRLGDVCGHIKVLCADLSDGQSLQRAVTTASPDVVIHLEWEGITADARNAPHGYGVGHDGDKFGALIHSGYTNQFLAYGIAKLCSRILAQKFWNWLECVA